MPDNTLALKSAQQDGSALERYVGPRSWPELIRQAQTLFSSGLLPRSVRSPEAAIAIIQTGRELQLNPMEAFRNVHVIEGTPTVSPKCKLGLIQRSGLLSDMRITEGEGWAECTMQRRGQKSPVTVRFTLDEAKAAGLTGKQNWKSWPRNMLRWRAIGYVADMLFSDVTGGHFTPDELGADTDADGVVVEPVEDTQSREEEQRVELAQRVNATWHQALTCGWTERQVGQWFAERGVRRKSAITEQLLDEFRQAVEHGPDRSAEEVIVEAKATAVDWSKDPALEGL